MPYVRSIAGKIKKTVAKEIDFEDLVEYGMIGLLEAADRFDPDVGANFMTFAYYRIRGSIYDGLRGMGWMSRTEYAKARFEERANDYLAELAQAEEDGTEKPENPFEMAVQDLASAVQGLAAVYITTIDGTEGLQIEDKNNVTFFGAARKRLIFFVLIGVVSPLTAEISISPSGTVNSI